MSGSVKGERKVGVMDEISYGRLFGSKLFGDNMGKSINDEYLVENWKK
jgi:hypothetical protein